MKEITDTPSDTESLFLDAKGWATLGDVAAMIIGLCDWVHLGPCFVTPLELQDRE